MSETQIITDIPSDLVSEEIRTMIEVDGAIKVVAEKIGSGWTVTTEYLESR